MSTIFGQVGKAFQCRDGDTQDTPVLRERRIRLMMSRLYEKPPEAPRHNIFTGKPYRADDLVAGPDD